MKKYSRILVIGLLGALPFVSHILAQNAQLQDSESFNSPGVGISFNDSWSFTAQNTNVTINSVTLGTTDYLYAVGSGIPSNSWVRIKNTSPTNGFPLIVIGNDGTNFPMSVQAGEVTKTRIQPDPKGFVHIKGTNGSPTAAIATLPI